MAFIDGSALTVALPKLRAFFDADLASVQWVLNGYILALAALTLIGGALADHYGKAHMLGVGCIGFGLASAACVVAPSVEWLIAFRVAQGISAAILTPSSLALIGATYPKEERNHAIGVWAAASALTTAGGPVLGGWLTENFGWQWVFAINPPLALIAVALLLAYAPADQHATRQFDVVGAAILAGALGALSWALNEIGPDKVGVANGVTTAVVTVLGVSMLAGYAVWELASTHPMTPPRLMGNRTFVGLNVATLLIYAGLSIMFFLLSFDLIDRRGLTPTDAGLAFLPFTLGVGFLSQPFGAAADKIGARTMLIAGPLGAALALLLLALGKSCVTGCWRHCADGALGHLLCSAGGAAHCVGDIECDGCRRGACLRNQQCCEPRRAACGRCAFRGGCSICGWISGRPDRSRCSRRRWCRHPSDNASAGRAQASLLGGVDHMYQRAASLSLR